MRLLQGPLDPAAWERYGEYSNHESQCLFKNRETREIVAVPNIWYNQPVEARASVMRWHADRDVEYAKKIEREVEIYGNCTRLSDAKRYRKQAKKLRELADEMERTGRVLA